MSPEESRAANVRVGLHIGTSLGSGSLQSANYWPGKADWSGIIIQAPPADRTLPGLGGTPRA